jgi:hypothetical protein
MNGYRKQKMKDGRKHASWLGLFARNVAQNHVVRYVSLFQMRWTDTNSGRSRLVKKKKKKGTILYMYIAIGTSYEMSHLNTGFILYLILL